MEGAERRGISLSAEFCERFGLVINALGNGLALEKLADPDAFPNELYGDMLVLIFQAFEALARESLSAVDPGKKGAQDG